MIELHHPARAMWHRLEPIHAVVYFADEVRAALRDVGLRGFWMGYFAARAAPMGPTSPGVVTATFFNFHPEMVARAIPDAWSFADPNAILEARAASVAAALRRLVPEIETVADDANPLLVEAVARAGAAGRPLFAANRDLALDNDPVARLWQLATTLREHRGDGHVALLTAHAIDGCEAHIVAAAAKAIPTEVLRDNRGWSPDDWSAARDRLRDRGLLDAHDALTETGRTLTERLEDQTDSLAGSALADDNAEIDGLLDLLGPAGDALAGSSIIPYPNPMGLPRRAGGARDH